MFYSLIVTEVMCLYLSVSLSELGHRSKRKDTEMQMQKVYLN